MLFEPVHQGGSDALPLQLRRDEHTGDLRACDAAGADDTLTAPGDEKLAGGVARQDTLEVVELSGVAHGARRVDARVACLDRLGDEAGDRLKIGHLEPAQLHRRRSPLAWS